MGNIYRERLEEIRAMMRSRGWDALIMSGSDPHCSEYPAARWKQTEWLTGFTGEAADIVITLDHAGLWTDTRYFIQAGIQLEGTGYVLHKTRVQDQVLIPEWLSLNLDEDSVIVADGLCQTIDMLSSLAEHYSIASIPNLLDVMWKDRPEIPVSSIRTIDPGESRASKIEWLREYIASRGADGMLISSLDEIAWMLNVRASDIDYNPMVISYLYVGMDEVRWFVTRPGNCCGESETSFDLLSAQGISIEPYQDAEIFLSGSAGSRILVDSSSLNYHLWSIIGGDVEMVQSPIQLRKAVKNVTEIEGMRKAHLNDGICMERFLYWLEKTLSLGRSISEWDASCMLARIRSEAEGYISDSFETISAYGAGAALPHYVTPKDNSPIIEPRGLYLCDSGAQYSYGTTDITRTVPLGPLNSLEKEDYTLVLKGHIDLAMAIFPEGTAGCQLDVLARMPLWSRKRNFGHGTGHGVGYFLGVHEGPHDIRQNFNATPLQEGMVCSDEPGIYREGNHGVRHENLLLCKKSGNNAFGRWMEFETLTLCHFDTSAIVKELLGGEQTDWLNAYNRRVRETLSPHLPAEVADWLAEKTKEI